MISKNQLKNLASYRQMKKCDEESLFVVEGVKMGEEALRSGFPIRTICALEGWIERHPALPAGTEVMEADYASLERLSMMKSPQEVWMLVERKEIKTAGSAITLVCDRVQDPGNMGTIIRIADWYGVRRVVCSKESASCYNPKVVQSTMGGIFRTAIEYADLSEWLQQCKMPIYGAVLGGESLYAAQREFPAALVIGNESQGISEEVQALLTHRITIPNIGGTAESLNAAVATGIVVAEFFRGMQ